jgi:hypothetical protein
LIKYFDYFGRAPLPTLLACTVAKLHAWYMLGHLIIFIRAGGSGYSLQVLARASLRAFRCYPSRFTALNLKLVLLQLLLQQVSTFGT